MNKQIPDFYHQFISNKGLNRLGNIYAGNDMPINTPRKFNLYIGSDVCWMITIVIVTWIIAAYS